MLRRMLPLVLLGAFATTLAAAESPDWATRDLKAGIIGTDTSHVPAFTGLFHKHPEWRVKVVAAVKAGSPDVPSSANRVEKYAQQIHEQFGVEIVPTIDALLTKVDAVLVESVDGRPHLAQARPVLVAGKPCFIDKPFTAGLADARAIIRIARETGTPFFSCSCARFQPEIQALAQDAGVGKVTKVQGSAPFHIEPHHPDLFWYGIHGVEALYTVMGPGCVRLTRKAEGNLDITTGTWKDGRIGVFRGVRKGDYKPIVTVWGAGGKTETTKGFSYEGLVRTMAEFFHTGKPPIDPAETLKIIEFMTAAQLSNDRGGAEVRLDEIRAKP